MGRSTEYEEEIALTICELIASGKSLKSICEDESMPAQSTVYRWLIGNSEFSERYARAREVQADTLFDEVLSIADTPQIGEKRKIKEDGGVEVSTGDMIEHRRLQVDARKWMASKLQPKKYGDKLDLNVDGKLALVPSIEINGKSG
ncbi:hypothetical protein D3C80_130380 [compost metagenome]